MSMAKVACAVVLCMALSGIGAARAATQRALNVPAVPVRSHFDVSSFPHAKTLRALVPKALLHGVGSPAPRLKSIYATKVLGASGFVFFSIRPDPSVWHSLTKVVLYAVRVHGVWGERSISFIQSEAPKPITLYQAGGPFVGVPKTRYSVVAGVVRDPQVVRADVRFGDTSVATPIKPSAASYMDVFMGPVDLASLRVQGLNASGQIVAQYPSPSSPR